MSLSGVTPQNSRSGGGISSGCLSCDYSGKGGTVEYDDDALEVRTGVTVKFDGDPTSDRDAIQLRVKCSKDPHVLQFINREILDAHGNHVARTMRSNGGTYEATTDPNNPVWNTDSGGRPSPYYDAIGLRCNCPGQLLTWDQPSFAIATGETWKANFAAFIICDGKVIRRVDWSRSMSDRSGPSYTVKVTNATGLPSWATNLMRAQGYEYP